ncbi:MAG: glycosyltransferase family 87 protein [Opitutaceae bacterium]
MTTPSRFARKLPNLSLLMTPRAGWRVSLALAACAICASAAFGAAAPKSDAAKVSAALTPDGGRIVIETSGLPPPPPLFFSANVDQSIRLGAAEITGELKLKIQIIQGKPEVIALGLSGDGEIVSVSGKGLRDWAVRQGTGDTGGKRFLDVRPFLLAGVPEPKELELVIQTRQRKPSVPGTSGVLLLMPGDAVGFTSRITLTPDATVDFRIIAATGMIPVGEPAGTRLPLQFSSTTDGKIDVMLMQRGAALAPAEILNAQLVGRVNEATTSTEFRLRGQFRVQKAGARLRVLSGRAALNEKVSGEGWHVELVAGEGGVFFYELVGDREGVLPLDLSFTAAVEENGDWRKLDFQMPAGSAVPLRLEGLPENVEFDATSAVVPNATAQGWQGFLPANGAALVSWKHARKAAEGTLFFTSLEQTEVRIGAGLLRQESQIVFRILQGKLTGARIRLDGPGEILGVMGTNVVGWNVLPATATEGRILEVRLSRPFEGEGSLVVRSQSALDRFPVRAEPLRLTPEGAVRHSGFLRVANNGAVRLEVADVVGMLQLAPAQFPGAAVEGGARQVFVYRFPSATYDYRIVANQIQSEVSVSQIVTYELTETDRVINAELEIDVREAPLRDWSLRIPEDYAVVALTGSDVVDHTVESAASEGYRTLKILFGRAIDGRQLLKLRLEKNQPAAAGEWRLPPLVFTGAKSVRGHIGAVSAPGYRMVPVTADRLVEVPLSFFPRQMTGLQQAWRLRESQWTAALRLEALGQSVQADVFHLYSLKEGVVYGSVLFNYFVVGAPANEWRIEVPETVGNIDVVGQNVRRDWRREGNQVIVALHQPVLGAATLLITFEQPMSARGGTIHPGELRALGVQGERGFVQVVSPLQVKHTINRAEGGLLKLEPLELPAEFRLLTTSPSLAVYQYTARPFTFEMGIEWYPQAETVDQVVDFAKLSSQVSRDGQVVTDARFFVKTRGRKALRLVLPAGMKLWEARVDREVVTARSDGDQTLVPLPARMNPNDPVEVALRLGQATSSSGSKVNLLAPKMMVPVIIEEWTLRSDSERLLVPKGGNAELVRPPLTETGFEWIAARGRYPSGVLLGLTVLAALLLRGASSWRLAAGLVVCAIALGMAGLLAFEALATRRVNVAELTYAATVMPTGEPISIQVSNLPVWRALLSWWGAGAVVIGIVGLIASRWLASRALAVVGVTAVLGGVLAQRPGAAPFFAVLAAVLFLFVFVPNLLRLIRQWRNRDETDPETGSPAATVLPTLALLCCIGFGLGAAPDANAAADRAAVAAPVFVPTSSVDRPTAAQSLVQTWSIRETRLFADLEVSVRGAAGDSFLLLKPPAVLTEFKGDGLRVSKVERDGQTNYYLVLERDGLLSGRAKFEMATPDLTRGLPLPTGPAALQRITVDLDQGGWDFTATTAVQVLTTAGLAADHSGATLILTPSDGAVIQLKPRQRNLSAEVTQFFAEANNLYLPGPGVVNGYTRITVRPAQGRVSELELEIPKGFTVGEVSGGPVGAWRFDPEKRRLHVAIEPAQTGAFRFNLEMQLGTGPLPLDLALEPIRILGAAGEVGMIAIAFGGDAQPEGVRPGSLSPVNLEDFDASLVPRGRDGQPLAVVQQVWRYGREGGRVELKVAPVAAEVRVAGRQLLSLDDDRLVIAADLNVAITRVGLFQLSFVLPAGLEVEALSGPSLNHWTEATENGQRIITLHLNGRTIGDQNFNLTLAGAAPGAQDSWSVPRLQIREATRQTGEIILVPGKGIRLRALERQNATQLDPRTAGALQPGTLAFRLLQEDWALRVGIEMLEAWVTTQALQEITVREGQTLTRIALRHRIENAALKQMRLRLPGLTDDQVRTVRATGSAVSDFVKITGETDLWEIHFQRGIAGETDVQIEFQGAAAREQNRETITTPIFVGARQATLFVAVRSGGRLELDATDLPRGWQRVDWSAVPTNLQSPSDRTVPAFCFRVAEPEGPLTVGVRRHDVAEALKLRVTRGELTTLFSPEGASLTAVDLTVQVVEKSTLSVRLPEGARLFNTFVNGESVSVVRDGAACLFHVSPNTGRDHSAAVRMVYAVPGARAGRISLVGPSLSVPLENVAWRVVLPPGYKLDDYQGSLRLSTEHSAGYFGVEQYQALVSSTHTIEAKKATALFDEANVLMQRGEQQQASEVLSRAAKNGALDQAANEDARVQLKELKTQQAVLGLNTRRQRLYLDNRGDGARNEQLEQAATLNPFMQGKTNFNPQQVDQLLMGNTVEENTALRGIAGRIVEQQLAAEPAPSAIDITLPERGRVVTFTRSLQVDGSAPLGLTLTIEKLNHTSMMFVVGILAGLALIAAVVLPRKELSQSVA